MWKDTQAGKDFYDLLAVLHSRVSLSLTFTTGGIPPLRVDELPDIPWRLSCHSPEEAPVILRRAKTWSAKLQHVGINLLLWRSKLEECRRALLLFLEAGINDVLLLPVVPVGFGRGFTEETLSEDMIAAFLSSLRIPSIRLTACHKPPRFSLGADLGCGANDWFVAITAEKVVQSCSFTDHGHPLTTVTYQALLAATAKLSRLPCYRSLMWTP